MMLQPIITDPTDNDVYKFSMSNFLFKQGYLREVVGWQFFNRGNRKFPLGYGKALQAQVDSWANLSFKDEHLDHLKSAMYWLDHFYIYSYLKTYRFKPDLINIETVNHGDYEDINVTYEGEWGEVIFFEIYLLSTMSELYNIMVGMDAKILPSDEIEKRDVAKIAQLAECGAKVAEFGTRRRYSKANQDRVIALFLKQAPATLQGTSNVMFARKYGLTPIGTMGHELIMFMGAKFNPTMANEVVMKRWVEVYNGALGIYLPDTYTTKHFLKYFDLFNSKLWDGVREDSAPDTDAYVDTIIEHYKKLRIDPSTKTINHSNSISSIEQIVHMQKYREKEIRRTFGIGTWLTNDVYVQPIVASTDVTDIAQSPESVITKPVDWVIKMTHAYIDGRKKYCVKVSDMPMKVTSVDEQTTQLYMRELYLI